MSARLSALLVWGLVAAAAVFWTLRLSASSIPVPAATTLAGTPAPSAADLGRLLGVRAPVGAAAPAPAPDVAARFRLTGVVAAGRREGAGVALIAIDGKPARAYRVGDRLDAQLVLQSVALRSARIGGTDGAQVFALELPPPTPPATGTLAALGAPPPAFAPPVPAPPPTANRSDMASIVGSTTPAPPMPVPPPGAVDQANEESRLRALSR